MFKLIAGLFVSFSVVDGAFYKTNDTDLSNCKIYYSRSGSVYKDFFEVSKPKGINNSLVLDFHFAVLAPSDAHILLAPSATVTKDDPVYEVVIGAGGNTFSDIRRQQKAAVKVSVRAKGKLSALDPKAFWLHISKDGVIDIGDEGEELPFLSYTDPDLLPISVMSFSTWSGIEAKWYYDCPMRNDSSQAQELEKKLTHTERLRRDILSNYDPYSRPVYNISTITTIYMSLTADYFNLNEHKSYMELIGSCNLTWHDEKLQWNKSEYGEIEYLHIFRREIWQPDLLLIYSIGDEREMLQDSMLVVDSSGLVNWKPRINIKSWCDANNMGKWPDDSHTCELLFCFGRDILSTQLVFMENSSLITQHENSEWLILSVDSYTNEDNETESNNISVLQLSFTVKRSSKVFNTVFFTPFLVLAASLLSSFWISPFGHLKVSLGCLQLLIAASLLIGLALFVPSHSKDVPYLIQLYSYSLVASLISLVIGITVINLSRTRHKYSTHHLMTTVLKSNITKMILCLPDIKTSEEYGQISESSSKLNDQSTWILLGAAIDRIAFIIYFPLVIYAIYLNC